MSFGRFEERLRDATIPNRPKSGDDGASRYFRPNDVAPLRHIVRRIYNAHQTNFEYLRVRHVQPIVGVLERSFSSHTLLLFLRSFVASLHMSRKWNAKMLRQKHSLR